MESNHQKNQCLEMHANGQSIQDIASYLNLEIGQIQEWLTENRDCANHTLIFEGDENDTKKTSLTQEDAEFPFQHSQTLIGAKTLQPTGKETLSGSFFENWLPEEQSKPSQEDRPSPERNLPISNWGDILGEGGMGIIRSATQNSMGREIAVKQIKPNMLRPNVLKALLQEAWITGFLEHPNIIPIYDIIHNELGHPMILMKQITGRTWLEYLKNPNLITKFTDPIKWHLSIFQQVCHAIEYAHSRGIIHLDLKPENIMIGEYGEVYVMDWGIAGSIDDRHQHWLNNVQERQYSSGSPWYMAPEMLTQHGKSLSIQSDIYLLGAILYEIVTGNPPHKAASMELIMQSIANFTPAFRQDTCVNLQKIIMKAMQQFPTNRHSSVEALRLEIEEYLNLMDLNTIRSNIIHKIQELEQNIAEHHSINQAYAQLFAAHFGIEQLKQHPKLEKDYEEHFQTATRLLIQWELEKGKPDSAEMLLNYLNHPPNEIIDAIAKLREENSQKEHRLRKADINYSTNIGVRTRNFILLLACIGWTSTPAYKLWDPTPLTFLFLHSQTILSFVGLLGLGYWARHSLSSTRLNRQTYSMLLMEPLLHALGDVGAMLLGWSPIEAWILRMMIWAVLLSVYALLVEVRFTITAIISGLLTIAAFANPTLIYWNTIILNVTLVIINYVIWNKDYTNSIDARELDLKDIYKKVK